jgi:hypothetical protein
LFEHDLFGKPLHTFPDHALAGVSLRFLDRHSRQHRRLFRRHPKIARRFQGTPDVWIFRAAIESNQLHAVAALSLETRSQSLCPLAKRLATVGTDNLYAVGHTILPRPDLHADFCNLANRSSQFVEIRLAGSLASVTNSFLRIAGFRSVALWIR